MQDARCRMQDAGRIRSLNERYEGMRPQILYPGGWAGTVHSGNKEAAMGEHSLTIGAHVLLWVFPLVLVVGVLVENFLDSPNSGDDR